MDLIAYAIPFFLAALALEYILDRRFATGYFRTPETLSSLSAGAVSNTSGLFSKALEIAIYGGLISFFNLPQLDSSLFDLSARGIALWVAVLFFWDFCYYWHHRLGHEVNLLWAAHVVHHQSEEYNLSTALRQTSSGFLFGWVFYLPMLIFGIPVGVIATVAAIDLIYQFWVHTRFVGKLGWFDRVFVSPSNHRVHHAQNARYLDKNYGGILIVWDRLFGTFQPELESDPCVFGVRKPLKSWNPVTANLQVYRNIFEHLSHAANGSERWAAIFRGPGWRPAALGGPLLLDDSALLTFKRFDPTVAVSMRPYIVVQFLCATLLAAWLSQKGANLSPAVLVGFCLALWSTLVAISFADNVSPWFVRVELARIAIITLGGLFWLTGFSLQWSLWFAYGTGSLLFFVGSLRMQDRHQGGNHDG